MAEPESAVNVVVVRTAQAWRSLIVSHPNVSMHEGKAFTCQVRKGRLAQPSDVPSTQVRPRPRPEPMPGTDRQAQPEGRTA